MQIVRQRFRFAKKLFRFSKKPLNRQFSAKRKTAANRQAWHEETAANREEQAAHHQAILENDSSPATIESATDWATAATHFPRNCKRF